MATTVVPWRTVRVPDEASVPERSGVAGSVRRRRAEKLGPGSSPVGKSGRPTQLLPALLDVVADELLGVLLQDLVDLVQEVVQLGLQLLSLGPGGRGLLDHLLF